MKKILLGFALTLGTSFLGHSKVLTVSNHTLSAGKYTKIQDAVDAAAIGDTIYVHGSTTSYGSFKINKRLVLIGAGHNLKETQHNLNSNVDNITLEATNSSILSSGSIIKGFNIYGISGTATNILIERNNIQYFTVGGDGWLLRNNIFGYCYISNFKNIIVSNNVFNSVYYSDKPSVIITNNVIIGGAFSSVSYATITNNIFIERRSDGFSGSQNTYNKNISIYWDQINFYTLPPALNSGVGNLNTVDSQFMTDITGKSISDARNIDWRLNATSLGVKYGTDGTDCGIYGGSYPMPNMTGATTLPQVISVDIQNSVIPVGGTLNVELKAKSIK